MLVQRLLLSLLLINLIFIIPANCQTLGDVLNPEMPSTWIGIDFSHARYSGETGKTSLNEMKEYFAAINALVLEESSKYNFSKIFRKSVIIKKTELTSKLNSEINSSELLSNSIVEINRIDKKDVEDIIKSYDTQDLHGTAIVVIMEDMSKTWEQASMWVVNFDPVTKTVITSSKLIGEATGLGFRNHWSSAIDQVLGMVKAQEYKKWQKAFAIKK